MSKIVVVSAHPDDEVLGAGGTLLKHVKKGDQVYWLITTGISESNGFTKERVIERQKEIRRVEELMGFEKTFLLDYPTMNLSGFDLIKMVPQISKIFHEIEPEIIYCVNRSDAHSDHRITFDAVMACTKSFRYPYLKKVLLYECISETEFAPALPEKVFLPNHFVEITDFFEEKLEVMRVYESELGHHPFPRSEKNIEALAVFRGASVGVELAEAFQMIKSIDK